MLFVSWIYQKVFTCCFRIKNFLFRPDDPKPDIVHVSRLPWLWIGGITGDDTIDYTLEVNDTITHGMLVTKEWLEEVTDASPTVWKYLDPKSLEEKDFPSEGFVIEEDDTNSEELENASVSSSADPDHIE